MQFSVGYCRILCRTAGPLFLSRSVLTMWRKDRNTDKNSSIVNDGLISWTSASESGILACCWSYHPRHLLVLESLYPLLSYMIPVSIIVPKYIVQLCGSELFIMSVVVIFRSWECQLLDDLQDSCSLSTSNAHFRCNFTFKCTWKRQLWRSSLVFLHWIVLSTMSLSVSIPLSVHLGFLVLKSWIIWRIMCSSSLVIIKAAIISVSPFPSTVVMR